ncbi:Nif3-like dinuclear metal center hexameric protein [Candidatus Woesearchaeota archaeon]|nr:Nif3-like dinuclear metal center hexameric protein [Candidatus Woesearchaeota archaeon]
MVELDQIVTFLDSEIDINSVPDKCRNGLQFQGSKEVNKVGVAVDASLKTIKKAIEEGCNLLIVHHALIWQPPKIITGLLARKIKLLVKNNISIYCAHLPLDIHKKYSHGVNIADELGLHGINLFGESEGYHFGVSGNLRKKISLEQLKESIDLKLKTNSTIVQNGPNEVGSIAIVSGTGSFAVEEAANNIDCLIIGDAKYGDLVDAKDLGVNLLIAGHYETETLGMVKLSHSITKKFKIHCQLIE